MADRLSQYPMLSNFNNNMLQQHQLQQQQSPQQHQDSHSILPSGVDQTMIWQQMQMQPQFRPHGAVEMNSPTPTQFADLMKRPQGINRVHGAAQLQLGQQQQQQSFALGVGMPQMSGGSSVLGGASQPQPFHDSSSNHAQAPHMPPGFPNMGGMANGNINTSTSIQQRRQLGLIAMAQNQQSQNGPGNFNKFNQQQQQFREQQQLREREQQQQQQQQFQTAAMNHSSPGDIFSSPGMSNEAIRRPSPHPVNIQSTPNMAQGPAPQAGNIVTPASNGGRIVIPLQELSNRAMSVRHNITQIEGQIASVSQQINVSRSTPQEAPLMQRLKDLSLELTKSKDYLQKLMGMANYSKQHGGNALQHAGGPNSGQPSWMLAPQSFEQNIQAARSATGQVQGQQQQQPNVIQPSPSLSHTQSQGNHLGFVPPRSGPTPQQQGQPGSQHPPNSFNMPTNAMGTAFSFPANGTPSTGSGPSPLIQSNRPQGSNLVNHFGKVQALITPLDKTRFDLTYKNFCQRKGLKLDQRLLTIESQPIDLHALHVQVLQEGGSKNVEEKDMWNIIGARLGFVQFHGTGNEPAKSAPGIAQQLAQIYKEYLAQFDGFYVTQTLEQRMKIQQANANFQAQMAAFNWSPQQMQTVIALSHMSLQDLHAQNVPEKMIQFVENHRASLQRAHHDQKNFQRTLRANPSPSQGGSQTSEQGRPSIPGAPGIGPSNSFAGSPAQHNVALTMAARQQFLQHQQQQQQQLQNTANMMQGRPPQQGGPQLQQPTLPARPNSQAMAHAESLIAKYKHEYTTSNIPAMQAVDVPVDQRVEYNRILEQLFRQCLDTDQKLGMIYVLLKQDDLLQKLITIICTVQQQRSLLSITNNPRYIITLDTIRNMASELQRATDMFTNMVHVMVASHRPSHQTSQQQQQQQPQQFIHQSQVHQIQQQQIVNNNLLTASNATSDIVPHLRLPIPQQQSPSGALLQQQQQQPQNLGTSLRPQVPAPSLKVQRKPQQSLNTAAVSTPSPAAVHSAATPVASAPTPTAVASSPPASKSPKGKASGKPKATTVPTKRRVSRAVPPPVPPIPAESVQPSPSTSNRTIKRPRDDDMPAIANGAPSGSGSTVTNEPSPPKRVKTEWDSAPSEVLRKKNEVVDGIKTEEDASVFLEQMTAELIKMAANGEGQESLSSDISDTLEMILKGYGPIPDTVDISNAMSSGESGIAREPSPPPAPLMDAFDEFFDFSFGTVDDDENNSKAPTPDLVSSSSTNLSPESNHEADAANHALSSLSSSAMDIKTEEPPDALRLGTWKEIDHGEATYYNPPDWKWDSPMPSHDQPWAIFNS